MGTGRKGILEATYIFGDMSTWKPVARPQNPLQTISLGLMPAWGGRLDTYCQLYSTGTSEANFILTEAPGHFCNIVPSRTTQMASTHPSWGRWGPCRLWGQHGYCTPKGIACVFRNKKGLILFHSYDTVGASSRDFLWLGDQKGQEVARSRWLGMEATAAIYCNYSPQKSPHKLEVLIKIHSTRTSCQGGESKLAQHTVAALIQPANKHIVLFCHCPHTRGAFLAV